MNLNIDDEFIIKQATHYHIDKHINNLGEEEFAVLIADDDHYIQVYISEEADESIIEYRDGSEEEHYQAKFINKEATIKTFSLYLDSSDAFKDGYCWRKITIDESEYIEEREDIALKAIQTAFDAKEDASEVSLFINHHLKELDQAYWLKHLGTETPEPEALLSILILKNTWDDDCVFDFTLPDNVTNYVISVRLDDDDKIESISMES